MEEGLFNGEEKEEETVLDASLRPLSLVEFVGQDRIKDNLKVFIEAAGARREALDHVLVHGFPGLGKTTIAYIISQELNVNIRTTSGPVLERPGDLAAILTNLESRDVLFIDEIHRLTHVVEEVLYPAMEDFCLDIVIDRGPRARSVKLNLPPFTLIGATTRAGLITSPLRSRFGIVGHLEFYSPAELERILARSARILSVETDQDCEPGEQGELLTRGYHVMRGYYKMDEKTDEVIKANPQVKVISLDWVLGRYDGVVVAEAPNEEAWLKFVEPMSAYLTTETLVAIPREKVLKIIEHR